AAAVLEDGVAAGAEREHLADGVERLPHRRRAGEGPEVTAAVLHDLAGDQDARPRVVHGDLHAHVALVVLQPDVVARPVLLDEVVLEDEGFLVAGGDQGLELGQTLDQEADLAALVGRSTRAQCAPYSAATTRAARLSPVVPGDILFMT